MFFWTSKLVGIILIPSNLLVFSLCIGVLGVLTHRRWGRRLTVAVTGLIVVVAVFPVPELLLRTLEDRFPAPVLKGPPAGIIVLGGATVPALTSTRGLVALNGAAERITAGLALGQKYPEAALIFTGGSADPFDQKNLESHVMKQLLDELGVPDSRYVLESQSRNTHENAVNVARLVDVRPDDTWLLVTSASHMPRSVGVFRQAGVRVTPWPVDYRTRPGGLWPDPMKLNVSGTLHNLDGAAHEYFGLAAYYATGRIATLFPKPDEVQ